MAARHREWTTDSRYQLSVAREDSNADGTYNKTWYHLTDAQFSTLAIIDDSATVIERLTYKAYGEAIYHLRDDVDGDRDVDQTDRTLVGSWTGKGAPDIGGADYNVDAATQRAALALSNARSSVRQPENSQSPE